MPDNAQQQTIAVIPARGGSKRLPGKNIMKLGGVPLLGLAIGQAQDSGVFDQIIVSTEDPEIAEVAERFGARLHRRDPALSTDRARMRDVCLAVLAQCFDNPVAEVESMAVLTATAALRTPEDIRACLAIIKKGRDYVTSVCDYFFYPHAAMVLDSGNQPSYQWPEIALSRGQDVPRLVVHNGAISWCRTKAFLESHEFMGPNAEAYFMDRHRSFDVDTEEDFLVMKAVWEQLRGENR